MMDKTQDRDELARLIPWEKVSGSSAIDSIGYEPNRQLFGIRTIAGKEYVYPDISAQQYREFTENKSKGAAWARLRKQVEEKNRKAVTDIS